MSVLVGWTVCIQVAGVGVYEGGEQEEEEEGTNNLWSSVHV